MTSGSGPGGDSGAVFVLTHHEIPPSLNAHVRANHWKYSKAKKYWGQVLATLLMVEGVPRRQQRARANATIYFTTNRRRDEGNFRYMLEKALGDALTTVGVLPDDTSDHFQFGRVRMEKRAERPGVEIRIKVWPNDSPLAR